MKKILCFSNFIHNFSDYISDNQSFLSSVSKLNIKIQKKNSMKIPFCTPSAFCIDKYHKKKLSVIFKYIFRVKYTYLHT